MMWMDGLGWVYPSLAVQSKDIADNSHIINHQRINTKYKCPKSASHPVAQSPQTKSLSDTVRQSSKSDSSQGSDSGITYLGTLVVWM